MVDQADEYTTSSLGLVCVGAHLSVVTALINFVAAELVAVRIDSTYGDCAALAIRRHDNATAVDNSMAFRDVKAQDVVINHRVRTEIGVRVPSNGVIGAVELAHPCVTDRLAIAADALDRDFHLIALSLINHGFCSAGLPVRIPTFALLISRCP